jgi:hypothetical protein
MTSDHFAVLCRNFSAASGYINKTMKAKLSFLLLPALAAAVQFAPILQAQSPTDKPARQFPMERRARWASLSEDERARLKAAHQKAMSDPAVHAARDRLRQARREFREVLRPALLKADPSIQPILEKLRAERPGKE